MVDGSDPLGGPEQIAAQVQQDSLEGKTPEPEQLAVLVAEAEGIAETLRVQKSARGGKLKLESIAQRSIRFSRELEQIAREAEPERYATGRIWIKGKHRSTSVLAIRTDNEETGEQTFIELLGWAEEDGEVTGRQLIKVVRREAAGGKQKVILEVDYSGNVTFAEGETPNAASRAFWEALGSVDIVRACFAKFDPDARLKRA